MNSLLVLARGMYDKNHVLPPVSRGRLVMAVAWAKAHPPTTLYTAASLPPLWPDRSESLAAVMARFAADAGAPDVEVLDDPCSFNTRGELEKFLSVATGTIVIVSQRSHLPRIFCYVWEMRGWRAARAAAYVSTDETTAVNECFVELIKIGVIALPASLQRRLEDWYAKRTHTTYDE